MHRASIPARRPTRPSIGLWWALSTTGQRARTQLHWTWLITSQRYTGPAPIVGSASVVRPARILPQRAPPTNRQAAPRRRQVNRSRSGRVGRGAPARGLLAWYPAYSEGLSHDHSDVPGGARR